MKYWNKRLQDASEYISGEQPQEYDSFVKLNTNENAFPPSTEVLEAIKKACNENLRYYPDKSGTKLRTLLSKKYKLSPEEIFIANGSDEIFTLLLRGFIEPDGLAAFPYPSYSLYYTLAELNGVQYETVPLANDFSFNLKGFQSKKYDLVVFPNPNNPTGTYCQVDQIQKFLQNFKGLLVVDEAYIDFYGGSAIELIKKFDNVIVTRSFSKSYSLAGLRIGVAIAHPDIINGFMKLKDSYNIDTLALAGAEAALKDEKTFKYNIRMMSENKEYLEERLEGMGFEIVPSRANFLFVKHPDFVSEELYTLLKQNNILVRHFKGDVQSEYIRITVGTMMQIKALCKELSPIVGE